MTLIASYQREDEIVLIGDLLVSRRGNRETTAIPSRRSGEPLGNPDLSGLRQKLVLVTPQIAVAWCGSELVARHVIREVERDAANLRTGDDFLKLLSLTGLNDDEAKSVSFIFYRLTPSQDFCNVTIQDYLTGQTEWGPRHKVKYAGSGTFHFLDSIGFTIEKQSGEISSYEETISIWLTRAAIAFFEEMTSDTPHNFYYGGGFELLIPWPPEGILKKIPYSTFFWRYDKEYLERIDIAFSMQYALDNRLIVNRFKAGEVTRYIIDDLLAKTSPATPPEIIIDNHFCIHYFLTGQKDNETVKIILQKGETKDITGSFRNHSLDVKITPAFLDQLRMFLTQ